MNKLTHNKKEIKHRAKNPWLENIPDLEDDLPASLKLLKLYSEGQNESICNWIIGMVASPRFSSEDELVSLWSKILNFDPLSKTPLTLYTPVLTPLDEEYFKHTYKTFPKKSSTNNIFEFYDSFFHITQIIEKLTCVIEELQRLEGPLSRQAAKAKEVLRLQKISPVDHEAIKNLGHFSLDSIARHKEILEKLEILIPFKKEYDALIEELEIDERRLISDIKGYYGDLKEEYLPKEVRKNDN